MVISRNRRDPSFEGVKMLDFTQVLAGPDASCRHQGRAARRRGYSWYALEQGIGRVRPGPRLAGELGADTEEAPNSLG
jgi:hypothetical protein